MEAKARGGQELHILPMTGWGKWASGFALAFIPLCGLFIAFLVTGPKGGSTLSFTPQMIPGLLAVGCAAAALVTGVIGLAFKRERSLAAFGATGLGLFVTAFVVGEFAIPPFD